MCFHTTHILYQCGCLLPLPAGGPGYKPPEYCSFVRWQYDMYHTQPDRLPEPVPLATPRTCPMYWGTEAFIGNVRVLVNKGDCPTHTGLAGLNAVEMERERHYKPNPPRKRLKNPRKKDHVYRWQITEGMMSQDSLFEGEEGSFRGVERVEVSAADAYASELIKPHKATATQRLASSMLKNNHYSNHIPANRTTRGPRGLYYNSNPLKWPEHKLLEARRRGVQMALSYPERRAPMPEGTVTAGMQVPPDPANPAGYPQQGVPVLQTTMTESVYPLPQQPILIVEDNIQHLTKLFGASQRLTVGGPQVGKVKPPFGGAEPVAMDITPIIEVTAPYGEEPRFVEAFYDESEAQESSVCVTSTLDVDADNTRLSSNEVLIERTRRRASTGEIIGQW